MSDYTESPQHDKIISIIPSTDENPLHYFLVYTGTASEGITLELLSKKVEDMECIDDKPHAFHIEILKFIKDIAIDDIPIPRINPEFMHNEFDRILLGTNVAANEIASHTRRGAGNIMITSPEFFDHLVKCYKKSNRWTVSGVLTAAKRFILRQRRSRPLEIFYRSKKCQGFSQRGVIVGRVVIYTTPFFNNYFPNNKALIMYKGATSGCDTPISAYIETGGNRICYNMAKIEDSIVTDNANLEYSKAENYFCFLG